MRKLLCAVAVACATLVSVVGSAAAAPPTFSNTTLFSPWSPFAFFRTPSGGPAGLVTAPHAGQSGNSEPSIDFGGADNTMAVGGLAWLPLQVNLWTGHFGDTPPSYFGALDTRIQVPGAGRLSVGDGDQDVEVTSAGTILLADLDFIVNRSVNPNTFQLGVSVTRCPAGASGPGDCTTTLIDLAGADRPWITTSGTNAWLSYRDGALGFIRVWRSTDDGRTWRRVSSPIPGQGTVTADAMENSRIGTIVADPSTGNVYQAFTAGEASAKGTSDARNNVYVARSTDGGNTWTTHLVFHAPLPARLTNFWPVIAVDPATGRVYSAWTDQHGVWVSWSADEGDTWSMALKVSPSALVTTVMPWVTALNGKVDVVYYGSTAGSIDDAGAVWNTYDSQLSGGAWSPGLVSNTPNHIGRVCLRGSACTADRELLEEFEVAEDPATGKAAVIYTDTTIDTWTLDGFTSQLPEIVLAYEQ